LNSPAADTRAQARWVPDFVALAAIWGASFLFTRWSMLGFGPVVTAALRVVIASAVLLPFMLLRGHRAEFAMHWKKVLLVGVINSAIPFVCIAFALQSISIGQSSVLNATVPLFGALIAWFWLGERPSGSRVVGLLIGFAGIALMASENTSFDTNALGSSSVWGIAASLLACLCYGIAASYTRRFLGGVPSLVSASGSQLGATIFLLPFCLWCWPAQAPSLQAWLAVSALGVLCTGTAYILYFRLIAKAGPARALTVTFAIPVFAIAYGVILLGEGVTHWMLGCALVIVLGTSLSSGLWSLPFFKMRVAE